MKASGKSGDKYKRRGDHSCDERFEGVNHVISCLWRPVAGHNKTTKASDQSHLQRDASSDKAATFGSIWRRFDEETSQYQSINQEATPNSELGRNILKGAWRWEQNGIPRLPTSTPLTQCSRRTIMASKKTLRVTKDDQKVPCRQNAGVETHSPELEPSNQKKSKETYKKHRIRQATKCHDYGSVYHN